ncbi:MAG TPA: class I SAM-dependent methyltransferase [Thermaerobacter sp.]
MDDSLRQHMPGQQAAPAPASAADDPDRFDFDAVFAPDDYLYFYGDTLTPERTAREVALIRTLLDLRPGQEVLDLACGHGRIAVPLAELGLRVTGLDRSAGFLALARQAAAERGVQAEFVRGDMRQLPWRDRFDAVYNVFTSFGYFPDEENEQVLGQVARALKPGGRFLLETQNREFLLRHMVPFSVIERGDDFLIDAHSFDPVRGRIYTCRTVIRDGRVRRARFFVRLYTPAEMAGLLRRAGMEVLGFYDETAAPLSLDSRRMVVVARRPG